MKETKIIIKFAGVNHNGHDCYVSEFGNYFAKMDDKFYHLNQSPEYGLEGIDGEPDYSVGPDIFKIVKSFDNE